MPKKPMKKPEKGKKPKKITTENPPGGPMTPGERARRRVEYENAKPKT